MKRYAILLILTACVTADQMFVPMDTEVRSPKPIQTVLLLDGEPKDRPFKVIGLVAPPEDEYDSYAEMLNAARKVAAAKGADAIFVESVKTDTGWAFDSGILGAKGGSVTATALRAKAIVWTK